MKKLIADYTEYNLWANTRICSFCAQVDEASLEKTSFTSFPTIMLTLSHIWEAETIYYKRLHHITPDELEPSDFKGSFNELKEKFLFQSGQLREYGQSLVDDKLMETITYTNTAGEEITKMIYEVLLHCINHSTYHRGQIINMLRGVGFTDFISNDLMTYYLEK